MFIRGSAASRHAARNGSASLSLIASLRSSVGSKSLTFPRLSNISGATTFVSFSHSATLAEQSRDEGNSGTIFPKPTVSYEDLSAKKQKHESRMKGEYGSFSPTNQELKDNIASGKVDPVQHMETVLQNPLRDADIEIICASIAGEMERIKSFPRKQRKSMFRPGFARSILLRLFKTEVNIWRRLLDTDRETMADLCYLALGEGLEEIVIGWLKVDFGQDESRTETLFRNDLLRMIIRAHLMYVDNHSADDAIRCIFKVDDMSQAVKRLPRSQSKGNGLLKLSIWPASTVLCSTLGTGKMSQTNTQLFDKFLAFFERYSNFKRDNGYRLAREYNIAAMRLNHPTSPDQTPALALLREIVTLTQHATAKEVQILLPARVDYQRDFCQRTWQLATREGQKEDAVLVDNLCESLYGSRPSSRNIRKVSSAKR